MPSGASYSANPTVYLRRGLKNLQFTFSGQSLPTNAMECGEGDQLMTAYLNYRKLMVGGDQDGDTDRGLPSLKRGGKRAFKDFACL